jgi:branched-chain amino acid transport system permease protein
MGPGGKGAIAILVVIGLSLPFWAGPYWTRIATGIIMWAGLALSWNVICGYAGYISFGHVAFFGIGAYSTAILMQPEYGWNFFATLPVGALVAGGLAALIGWPVLKLRGAYFAIGTWALGEAIREFATVVPFTNGSYGISLPPNTSSVFFYFVMLVAAGIAYLVCYLLLERSRFGYRVKAVRDSEVAARMQGINADRVKIEAFVLSAVIPAVLGGINAYWITFINPNSVLNTIFTDQMVVMVLLGGLGSLWGPALGAAVLYFLSQQFAAYFGGTTWYLVLIGVLVMAVVLVLPDGLVSLAPGARKRRILSQVIGGVVGGIDNKGAPAGDAASAGAQSKSQGGGHERA